MRYILVLVIFSFTVINAEEVKVYHYQGTAEEIGEQFAKDEGKRFLEVYKQIAKSIRLTPVREKYALFQAGRVESMLDEETKAEMQAFAKAAKVPYGKVLLINCFYDLFLNMGCRQVAAWGKKTKNGLLIHSRNLDWYDFGDALRTSNILLVRKYTTGNTVATLAWPGFFGSLTGCNNKGLVIAYNQLHGGKGIGEPIFLIINRMLRKASNIEEALNVFASSKLMTNGSIMISSSNEKKAVVIEIEDGSYKIRGAGEAQFIVNNNSRYCAEEGGTTDNYQGCGVYRATAEIENIDVDNLQKIMADSRVLLSVNLLTAIFAMDENALYLSCGRYGAAKGPYRRYTIFKTTEKTIEASAPE